MNRYVRLDLAKQINSNCEFGYTSLVRQCQSSGFNLIAAYNKTKNNSTYYYVNRETFLEGICLECGKQYCKSFRSNIKSKFTCQKCACEHGYIQRKATCIEIYDVDNPMKSPIIQEKSKQSCRIKYGVERCQSNPEIHKKGEETVRRRYFGKHLFQTQVFRGMVVATNMRKRGVSYHTKCKNVIRAREEKYAAKNGGIRHSFTNPEVKKKITETIIRRYGVRHQMQCSEIFKKWQRSSFRCKNITIGNKTFEYLGYERLMLCMLMYQGYSEDDLEMADVPRIRWIDKYGIDHIHYPDIYIERENRCIEVKSEWTLKLQGEHNVKAKQIYAKQAGYLYDIYVLNAGGSIVREWH